MRRILVLVFVLLSIQGFAQPSNYSWYKQRTRQYSFMADSAMYLPRYNGTPSGVRSNESSTISGMVGIDTTNHRQYFRSGSSWRRLANYTELGVDSIWRVAGTDSIYYSKQGTTYKIKDSTGGGSTPTLQQVLTAGSTLTTGNSVDVNGNDFEFINANEISIFSKNDGVQLESTALGLSSSMTIENDSTTLRPNAGILNIDSLRTWSGISDTLYKKPMTWDTRNGRWEYAANWYGGGGGGSYTASNGLTLSGSNFKLGGTLGESTSIAAAGYNFDITNSSQIEFGANEGGNVVLSSVNGSDLTVGASININPHLGELFIDTLDTFSDTTNFKPLVYRASTGKVERATYWPVGASGGTPAGNFGNLQINRNGAFAAPGSDSLDWESSTGLTVTGGTRTTTLGVNKAAPTATYAAEIASDGTYTTNLKLSNTGTPTSFLTLNSVYGDVLSVGSLFKGSEFLISQSDGIFGISQGANQIARFTASDGMYAGRRWQTKQGADVASSVGAITLGGDGNVFEITGTSSITLIANTNWQNGATVTLLFTSTATLTDGTANSGSNIGMELAGNANFTATADDVLTLVLSEIGGTQRWREVSRSVN